MPREILTARSVSTERTPKREVIKRDCKLCKDQVSIDYKQGDLLKKFMTERGKILPRDFRQLREPSAPARYRDQARARDVAGPLRRSHEYHEHPDYFDRSR